jgi:Uma2 family endonuclease
MIRTASPHVWTENGYPTSDGKPMAETDLHRDLMLELIETLKLWFADDPNTYVSGNLLVFYEKGNKRRHVSPDVFVVSGAHKHLRGNYLAWEEGDIDFVIELTSKTTMREDINKKRDIYLNKLGVKEYFLFDPREEYLKPSFQAFRRIRNRFVDIKPIDERFPSKVTGLHLERVGRQLRLWDPETEQRLLTPGELATAERARADQEAARANEESKRASDEAKRANEAEAEVERLRKLLEQRHRNGNGK